jgi:hypothetical protein
LARQTTDGFSRLFDETVAKLEKIQSSPAASQGRIAQLLALTGKVAHDIQQSESLVAKRVSLIALQAGVPETDVRAILRVRLQALAAACHPTLEERLLDAIRKLEAAQAGSTDPFMTEILEIIVRALRSIAARFDATPPSIRIVEPADGAMTNDNTPLIRVAYIDTLSGVRPATLSILLDGAVELAGDASAGAAEATINVPDAQAFPDGRHVLAARIEDAAGNAATAEASVVVDTRPPAITIASPVDGSTIATLTPEIVVQYGDSVEGVETAGVDTATLSVVINDVDRTGLFTKATAEARFQPTGLEMPPVLREGGNRIVVTLKDRVANAGAAEAAFTVVTVSPPEPPLPPPPVSELNVRLVKVSGDEQSHLVNHPFPAALMWQAVDADTGAPLSGIGTEVDVVSGEAVVANAPGYTLMTDGSGNAAVRIVPIDRAGGISVRVSVQAHPDAEALMFTGSAYLPRIDLMEVTPGPVYSPVKMSCGTGRSAMTRPSFDPYGWGAFPGEAWQRLMGVRVTDASGNPVAGITISPCLLGFDGGFRDSAGLVEFQPGSVQTDGAGRAFIAVWVKEEALPDLFRIRFELPEFAAGGATPSPLGVDWTLPVVSPTDYAGSSRRASWLVSGQGQVAVPGSVLYADLCFRMRYYTSLQTTQPGDRLELIEGVLQNSWVDPGTGLQTLQFSGERQDSISRVRVHLGAAPLPRLIGACGESIKTCIAVGPPEVRMTRSSAPQAQDFSPMDFVVPVTILGLEGGLRDEVSAENEFRLEMLLPVQSSPADSILMQLEGRTACREPIADGSVIAPSSRSVVASFAGVVGDRYAKYRSGPMVCSIDPADPGLVQTGTGRLPGGQDMVGGAPYGDILCQAPQQEGPPPAAALPLFNYMPRHKELRGAETPPFLLRRFIAVPIGDIPDQGDRVDPLAEKAVYSPSIAILFNPRNPDFAMQDIRFVSTTRPDRIAGFETVEVVEDNETKAIIGSLRFPRMAQNERSEGEARLAMEIRDRQGRLYRGEIDVVLVRQRLVQTIYGEAGAGDKLPPRLGIADVIRNRLKSPLGFPPPPPNTLDSMLVPSQFNAWIPGMSANRDTVLATSTANLHAKGNKTNAGERYRGSAIAAATVLLDKAVTANLTGGSLGYFAPLYVEEDEDKNSNTIGTYHVWQGAQLLSALQTQTGDPPGKFITPGYSCNWRDDVRYPDIGRVTGVPQLPAINPIQVLVIADLSEEIPQQDAKRPARIGGTVFVRQKPGGNALLPTVIRHVPKRDSP